MDRRKAENSRDTLDDTRGREEKLTNGSKGRAQEELMEETIGRERNGYCLAYEDPGVSWVRRKEDIYNRYD